VIVDVRAPRLTQGQRDAIVQLVRDNWAGITGADSGVRATGRPA
jgi:hypothetical protein